jgi:hypothetical protein
MAFSVATFSAAQTGDALPTTDDVVTKMLQQDALRKAQLSGYTATRHYIAVNKQRKAEMLVGLTCTSDGKKQFTILSEEGSSAIRKHVFYKMLAEETEASTNGNNTHITPDNYKFELIGKDVINERPAYVLRITPKDDNKYLIDGKTWVDATDFSIVRIEGSPAQNPSFWVHSVHFVHTYKKVGSFWFADSTHSVSEIRIFGEADLSIDNLDYTLIPPDNRTTKTDYLARLTR